MAVQIDLTEYLSRNTNLVPGSSDYTATFWGRVKTTPAGTDYATLFEMSNGSGAYVGIYTAQADVDKFFLEASDGVTFPSTDGITFSTAYRPFAYVREGNEHRFYCLTGLIGSFTLDLSAQVFDILNLNSGSSTSANINIFDLREWDAALTLEEIIEEWKSDTAVKTADLWSDIPLLANPDDISGNNYDLTPSGSITYQGTPRARNLVPITAIEVTIPSSNSYDANSTNDDETFNLFFTYLEPDGPDSIGLWAFGGTVGSGYQPKIYIVTLADVIAFSSQNPQDNLPVLTVNENPGERVYFRVEKNANANPADVELSLVQHNPQTPQAGDYFITGDLVNLPSAVLIPGLDYGVRRIIKEDLPASDNGDILLTGRILLDDRDNQNLVLFSPTLELLQTIDLSDADEYSIRASRPNNVFYTIPQKTTPATLRIVDNSGSVIGTKTVAGYAQNAWAIAPSNDQTILYFAQDNLNAVVQIFDLSSETFLGTFAPTPAGYFINEIMVLEDDTVLVGYYRGADDLFIVKQFDPDGNELNSYNFTYVESFPPRIGYSADNSPNSFLVFLQKDDSVDELSHIIEVNISDGTYIEDTVYRIYQNFAYIGPETETPDARFGPSSSCAMIQLMESVGPPTFPGIYKLTPGQPNDEYNGLQQVRIPTPFFKTYFHGE